MNDQEIQGYVENEILSFPKINAEAYSDPREEITNRLFRIFSRSKVRSGALGEEVTQMLKDKISLAVKEDRPLRFAYGMGGGKGYKCVGAPGINWAEWMHLRFLWDNFGFIAEVFEPGIEIIFSPDDWAVELINNYKSEWLAVYHQEFRQLLEYVNDQTPSNFKLTFKPSSEWYDNKEELHKSVLSLVDEMLEDKQKIAELEKTWINRALNNIYLPEGTSDEERLAAAKRSAVINMAWLDYDFSQPERLEFFEGGTNIPVVNFKDFPGYSIRVLSGSVVQFWKGNGYLKVGGVKIRQDIISVAKWAEISEVRRLKINTNLLGLDIFNDIPIHFG